MPYIKYGMAIIGYMIYGFWGAIIGFFLGSWLTYRFRRSSAGLFGLNPKLRLQRHPADQQRGLGHPRGCQSG